MYPHGRRGSADSTPPDPNQPFGARSSSGPLQGAQHPAFGAAQHDDDVSLPALEAGVSPIGGVYYSATPTALRLPERQQQQQQQQVPGRPQQVMSAPVSPGAGSSSSPMHRGSPGRVSKPVFGVKGAYSSMAARRYAAALAASGNADPDVLAEAIRAAEAEAEGNRAAQVDPTAAAGGAGSSGMAGSAALTRFGSGPTPQQAAAGGSSSSSSPAAAVAAAPSQQLASLVSPRMLHPQPAEPPPQGVRLVGSGAGVAAAVAAVDAGSSRRVSGQQMSPKTPAAGASRSQGGLNPLSSITEGPCAASPSARQGPGASSSPASPTPDWQGGEGAVVSSMGQLSQPGGLSGDSRAGVPVAQGVMGTPVRSTTARTSFGQEEPPLQEQQQQQQWGQAAGGLGARQGVSSFKIEPSPTSSYMASSSRSPSPPYRGRAAAAAATAAAATGAVVGAAALAGTWGGVESPARSASPARPPSGRGAPHMAATLITLEGASGASVTGTDGGSSFLAGQQDLQQPPQAATIPTAALVAAGGAGFASVGGAAAAVSPAAGGPSSRPVDLASAHGSSSTSSPLSQQWARRPAGIAAIQPGTGISTRTTPFMTPLGSRSSSFNRASADSAGGQMVAEDSHQAAQQQQQQQQQRVSASGGLLGNLWSYFSGGGASRSDEPTAGSEGAQLHHPASAAAAAAADHASSSRTHQQQAPAGWSSGVVAAGAAAAVAAGAAGAYGVSRGRDTGSSGHHSLDPITGLVVADTPAMQGTDPAAAAAAAAAAAGELPGQQHQSLRVTPGHTPYLSEGGEVAAGRAVTPPAAAAGLYGAGQGSPPAGMGHGNPPGHTVFAPGAVHGAAAVPYGSYAPVVGPGSANGSGSGGVLIDPYTGAVVAGGMLAAGAGAAAAAAGLATPTSGTIPAAVPGRFHHRPLVADSDVSSMFSNGSSIGEPLQPQCLPPVTWPAEALPSPTGSSSMHSYFAHEPSMLVSGYETPHAEGQALPRAQAGRPELEASEGGTAAGALGAAALGAAALGGAAALAAGSRGGHGEVSAAQEQPVVSIQLDAAAESGSGIPRRRSRQTKSGAGEEEQRKSGAGARRKSGLGGLFGVSTYQAKRSQGGKKQPTSPEPGSQGGAEGAAAAAAAAAAEEGGKERKHAGTAGSSRQRKSKKQRMMCIIIPLVILAILGGIGAAIGITMSQQRGALATAKGAGPAAHTPAAAAAPGVGQPLAFKVNMTLPPDETGAPAPSCSELFSPTGNRGKLESFLSTFKQAYAKGLNLEASDVKVGSLACDGQPVKPPTTRSGPAANRGPGAGAGAATAPAPPPRMAPVTWATVQPPARRRSLLKADAPAAAGDRGPVGGSRLLLASAQAAPAAKPAVLTTEFTVPAPADAGQRADLAATISEMSPQILEPSMTQLFGRPVAVQPAVEQPTLKAPPKPPAQPLPRKNATAKAPAPKRPVAPAAVPSPSPAPATEEAVPEVPTEGAPPVAPAAPEQPSTSPASGQSPMPAPTASPQPSPAPAEATGEAPPRAGGTWGTLLPPLFRPPQSPRPRWPFSQHRPQEQPPVPLLPPAPALPSPSLGGPEEATPVMVTLRPSPSPKPAGFPAPPAPPETFSWPVAVPCKGKPNGHTATPDAEGRLWGWQDGRSCAFKTPSSQPITINWDNAASCSNKPTTSNSVFDTDGRLWGWQDGRSCAYRGPAVQAAPAPGQTVITWEAAPSCSGTPDARNSVRNPQGQLWGWEGGKSCAFRIQNGVQQVTWAAAPVCKGTPNYYTSVRDDLGRLWGWESNESCRFSASS